MTKIPEPTRPSLSGYIQPTIKLLPWKWVDRRMLEARNYWITTHSSGFPSSRPVWGLWWSPHLLFSTGGRLARNISRKPEVQVNLESADELVIIEGLAEPFPSGEDAARWAHDYQAKYDWETAPPVSEAFIVRPRRILAWLCDSTGLDDGAAFLNSATEWRFE